MDRLTSMNKYSHSNMPGPHRSDAQPSIFDQPHPSRAPPDEHYTNSEHPTQRRRLDTSSTLRPHYPGDGLDFRRPVMSASGRDGSSGSGTNYYRQEGPIDLTDERLDESGPNTYLPHTATQPHTASDTEGMEAHSSNSRAQRLPRFQRDIIDLAGSDDEEQAQPQQQPQDRRIFGYPVAEDEDSLFIPETHPRPTTAGLRRPGFIRQPSPAMELNDVEFVASRPISRLTSRRPTPARASSRTPHPAARFDNDMNQPIDLTADDDGDDDDDVIHTSTRPLPSVNGDRPAMAGSGIGVRDPPTYGAGLGRLVQRMHRARPGLPGFLFGRHPEFGGDDLERIRANQDEAQQRAEQAREHTQVLQVHLARARAELVREGGGGGGRPPRPRPRAVPVINMNLNMDYGLVGFDLGFGAAPPRPPTPKYEPPPPAEKGFTHSPEENEEVVCPNCGDELAVSDGEVKQQIYVVKTCGHAYCGECATRERPHSSKKGKGKALDPSLPPPLKKCVVVGCEKSATKSQMIHVFMSS